MNGSSFFIGKAGDLFFGLGIGGALVFGRGTLYMKWGLILARHDRETRISIGIEHQRELVNHNLTFLNLSYFHNFNYFNFTILSIPYAFLKNHKNTRK